jgi:hypothetical protein
LVQIVHKKDVLKIFLDLLPQNVYDINRNYAIYGGLLYCFCENHFAVRAINTLKSGACSGFDRLCIQMFFAKIHMNNAG